MKFKEHDTVYWTGPNAKAKYATIISVHKPDAYTIEWRFDQDTYVEVVKESELNKLWT